MMPRQKSLMTVIRELVRNEISQAIAGLLGTGTSTKKRRRRGRRGPGRPPGSKNKVRRGPGRPPGSKNKKRRGPGRPPKNA
jgi:hypothetical protein